MASTAGLLVLLLGLLAGVAGDATAAGRCAVAADVAQSCARGVATPECCRSVAAISGGDCLCRDMAGLDLLALHAACGGARRLPTACKAMATDTGGTAVPSFSAVSRQSQPRGAPGFPERSNGDEHLFYKMFAVAFFVQVGIFLLFAAGEFLYNCCKKRLTDGDQ